MHVAQHFGRTRLLRGRAEQRNGVQQPTALTGDVDRDDAVTDGSRDRPPERGKQYLVGRHPEPFGCSVNFGSHLFGREHGQFVEDRGGPLGNVVVDDPQRGHGQVCRPDTSSRCV